MRTVKFVPRLYRQLFREQSREIGVGPRPSCDDIYALIAASGRAKTAMNHGLDTQMPTFSGDAEVDTKVPSKVL